MAVASDDHVIDERRPQHRACARHHAGQLDVLVARRGVTAGMVVHQDEGAGGLANDRAEHVARIDRAAVQPPFGDTARRAKPVATVEGEHPHLLVIEARQVQATPACDLDRRRHVGAPARVDADEQSLPQLEGRRQPRRFGEPHPAHFGRGVRPHARQTGHSATPLEQLGGDAHRRAPTLARAEQHRDQLGIGEAIEPFANASLARQKQVRLGLWELGRWSCVVLRARRGPSRD